MCWFRWTILFVWSLDGRWRRWWRPRRGRRICRRLCLLASDIRPCAARDGAPSECPWSPAAGIRWRELLWNKRKIGELANSSFEEKGEILTAPQYRIETMVGLLHFVGIDNWGWASLAEDWRVSDWLHAAEVFGQYCYDGRERKQNDKWLQTDWGFPNTHIQSIERSAVRSFGRATSMDKYRRIRRVIRNRCNGVIYWHEIEYHLFEWEIPAPSSFLLRWRFKP